MTICYRNLGPVVRAFNQSQAKVGQFDIHNAHQWEIAKEIMKKHDIKIVALLLDEDYNFEAGEITHE